MERRVDHYYYHQLNKKEQAVYRAFYDGVIMAHRNIIRISVKEIFERVIYTGFFM